MTNFQSFSFLLQTPAFNLLIALLYWRTLYTRWKQRHVDSPTVLEDTVHMLEVETCWGPYGTGRHCAHAGNRDICLWVSRLFSFALPSNAGHSTVVFHTSILSFSLLIQLNKFLYTLDTEFSLRFLQRLGLCDTSFYFPFLLFLYRKFAVQFFHIYGRISSADTVDPAVKT